MEWMNDFNDDSKCDNMYNITSEISGLKKISPKYEWLWFLNGVLHRPLNKMITDY